MRRKAIAGFVLFFVFTFSLISSARPVYGFYYDNPGEEAFSQIKFELTFPEVSFGAKNNLFRLENINSDLTRPGAKTKFLGEMADGSYKADFLSQLKAGLTVGRFSFQLRPWTAGSLRLAPGVPELIFVGYGPEENGTPKSYQLAGTKINELTAYSLDFKYGHPVPLNNGSTLGVGVTLRYVQGLAMGHTEIKNGTLEVDALGESTFHVKGKYVYTELPGSAREKFSFGDLFSNPQGSGVLLDLGLVYRQDPFSAGFALKNIGALKWKSVHQATYEGEGEIRCGPDGSEFYENTIVNEEKILTNYTMTLPIVLQLHGSYRFYKNLYWHLGMETGFSDGWGISASPCLQMGLEWRPRRLIRLAGDLAYHEQHLNYQALLELKLLCFWLRFQAGWVDQFHGFNAAGMFALHF